MAGCLFCKIVDKEIDATIVHETDDVLAFKDINPAAPTHVLVIPKRHVVSVQELGPEDAELTGKLLEAVRRVASDAGIDGGYRLVANVGDEGGQTVHHLHLHVLGGRSMGWPPG